MPLSLCWTSLSGLWRLRQLLAVEERPTLAWTVSAVLTSSRNVVSRQWCLSLIQSNRTTDTVQFLPISLASHVEGRGEWVRRRGVGRRCSSNWFWVEVCWSVFLIRVTIVCRRRKLTQPAVIGMQYVVMAASNPHNSVNCLTNDQWAVIVGFFLPLSLSLLQTGPGWGWRVTCLSLECTVPSIIHIRTNERGGSGRPAGRPTAGASPADLKWDGPPPFPFSPFGNWQFRKLSPLSLPPHLPSPIPFLRPLLLTLRLLLPAVLLRVYRASNKTQFLKRKRQGQRATRRPRRPTAIPMAAKQTCITLIGAA